MRCHVLRACMAIEQRQDLGVCSLNTLRECTKYYHGHQGLSRELGL